MQKFKRKYYMYNFFANFSLERGILLTFFLSVCHFNVVEVGILQALYALATACAEIPAGMIGDKLGRKNSLIIGNGLKLIGVGCFLLPSNFYLFSVLMILQGIGMAFISGADQALLFDNLKARKEAEQFINVSSIASSVIFLSAFIATILGGSLQSFSWQLVFALTSFASVCSIYFIFTLNDQEGDVIDRKKVSMWAMLRALVARDARSIRRLIIGIALFESAYMCFFMLSQNFFLKFEISIFSISIIYAVSRLLSMCIYYLLPKLRARIPDQTLLTLGLALVPMSFFIGLLEYKEAYVIMFFFISFVAHIAPSIYSGRLNELIRSEHRATLLSISSLLSACILSLLYFFAGNILEGDASVHYFICLAVLTLLGGLLVFYTLKREGGRREADVL
jgi:MFS family permease